MKPPVPCDECSQGAPGAVDPALRRKTLLSRLDVGDVVHAHWPHNEASLICLVTAVSDVVLKTRVVTTQLPIEFSRETGIETIEDRPAVIDSVNPLPADIYAIILEIDRKNRLEDRPDHFKLTATEKRVFAYIDPHYAENPL